VISAAAVAAGMAALWMPEVPTDGETAAARVERLGVLAESIRGAACEVTASGEWPGTEAAMAASLVAVGWHESGWAWRVHAGRCLPWECDAVRRGGVVWHRAASPWQLHTTGDLPPEEWRAIVGTGLGPTSRAAHAAASALARSRRHCGQGPRWAHGMVSGYATGSVCRWRGAASRVRTIWRVETAIARAAR